MRNNATFVYAIFLILGDFLALMAAFSLAYTLRVKFDPRPLIEQIPAMTFFLASLAVLPLWILAHAFIGLYNQSVYEKRFSELGRLLIGSFLGILLVIGYDFVADSNIIPARLVPVYGLGLGFGFLVLFRTIARGLRRLLFRYGFGVSNILIVGDTEASEQVANAVRDTRHSGVAVLAIVTGKQVKRYKTYTKFSEAVKLLRRPIHGIIQTELYKNQDKNNEVLRFAREHHASYRFVPGNSDLFVGNIDVELFAGMPVIAVHQTPLTGWGRITKRIFDIFAAGLLFVVTLPIMLLIAVAIKLSDRRGKVMFRQTRLTRFNREFRVFKFRTMKTSYSGMTPEEAFALMGKETLSEKYRSNGDFLENDPRITKVGRFLRRTSMDELPQLINVLKGDLSLVGPRALIPEELNIYEKRHAILSVKSGLTGLAQVSGRRDIDFEERRRLDMYYVQNWTFWMDISILLRTLRAVINGSGAK